jgi:hypothetical protein
MGINKKKLYVSRGREEGKRKKKREELRKAQCIYLEPNPESLGPRFP